MVCTPKLTLTDRLLLWISKKKEVGGLLIATVESDSALLDKVTESLLLIKTYDHRRYIRLLRDIERVWIRMLPGDLARFNASISACELDTRFVRDSAVEFVAAAIVHEATHARIWRAGIEYESDVRERVEMLCTQQERIFAGKLPNGRDLQGWIESALANPPDLGDAAFGEREYAGLVDALRHRGIPDWLIRWLIQLRRTRGAILRLFSRNS
jgi:hypothetical protein